jgi:hypothetical protein
MSDAHCAILFGAGVSKRRNKVIAPYGPERLSDGATGPTGLCALRAHHTRLIKTGDYQARSFTALEAAM